MVFLRKLQSLIKRYWLLFIVYSILSWIAKIYIFHHGWTLFRNSGFQPRWLFLAGIIIVWLAALAHRESIERRSWIFGLLISTMMLSFLAHLLGADMAWLVSCLVGLLLSLSVWYFILVFSLILTALLYAAISLTISLWAILFNNMPLAYQLITNLFFSCLLSFLLQGLYVVFIGNKTKSKKHTDPSSQA